MKAKTLLLLATLIVAYTAAAKPVSRERASTIASSYFPVGEFTIVELDGMYLVTPVRGEGFVLVAADDCVRPVLAYSLTGHYQQPTTNNQLPHHIASWLDGYRREIASLVAANARPSAAVQAMWDTPRGTKDGTAGEPLLTTSWAQNEPYNSLCPYNVQDSSRCLAGCVAVAMAQIMKFWNYPYRGFGNTSYSSNYGNLSANFEYTYYHWDRMPDVLTSASDNASVSAVAELIYHVGVALHTDYDIESSGAYTNSYHNPNFPCAENALKKHFGYSPFLYSIYKTEYSDAMWRNALVVEIEAGRPVIYSGYDSVGHAFVIDGVDGNGMFHVNWGWGGVYDGYYSIDSLSPGAGNISGESVRTYNINNTAVLGIMPSSNPSHESDSSMVIIDMRCDSTHGYISGNGLYGPIYSECNFDIFAFALDGYRFVRWQSGSTDNPVVVRAHGGLLLNDSAIFEPVCGDTVGYSLGSCFSTMSNGDSPWAIRLPACTHVGRCTLNMVQFVPTATGIYTVSVHIGDTITDATLVYSSQHEIVYEDQLYSWETHMLEHPLYISDDAIVWLKIGFVDNSGIKRPISIARFTGNTDGNWVMSSYAGMMCWIDAIFSTPCSWMIRGLFSRCPVNVAVETNLSEAQMSDWGITINGQGNYLYGDTVCLTVETGIPISWTWSTFNGFPDMANPHCFVATGDTVLHLNFMTISGIDGAEADNNDVRVVGRNVFIDVPGDATVGIYDLQGRLLSSCRTFTAPAAGVYMIHVNGIPARKIVIQ